MSSPAQDQALLNSLRRRLSGIEAGELLQPVAVSPNNDVTDTRVWAAWLRATSSQQPLSNSL